MNERVIGGRESQDLDHERIHLVLLNAAQLALTEPCAPLQLRMEALSILFAAFTVRGES